MAILGRRSPRRLDYSERAKVELLRCAELYERLYDVVSNMEWHLKHTPEHPLAEPVEGTKYWAIESNGFPVSHQSAIPGVLFIYWFDAEAVYVWDVRVTPPPRIDRVFSVA